MKRRMPLASEEDVRPDFDEGLARPVLQSASLQAHTKACVLTRSGFRRGQHSGVLTPSILRWGKHARICRPLICKHIQRHAC